MLECCAKLHGYKVKLLSTHLRERHEKLLETLERLARDSSFGLPIVVEGKKDVEALRSLGVQGRILTAKTGGKSRLELISEIERLQPTEVILLLDFDRRGKEWTAVLRQNLEKCKVKVNVSFRNELLRLSGRELKDVESLVSYLENLSRKLGVA